MNIFLPGGGGDPKFWRPVAERMPEGTEQVLVGWPGFGVVPADPRIRDLDDLVTYVSDRLEPASNLIAQSMGGVVAVRIANEDPLSVRRLVLVATSGGLDLASLGAKDWRPEFRQERPTAPDWFEAIDDMSESFSELGMPTLLLWGERDPLSAPAVGQRLSELIPNSRLVVIDGAGHDVALEHHERVASLIAEHLEPTPLDSVFNVTYVTKNIGTSGRLTEEALPTLASQGYHTVINLLPSDNQFHLQAEPLLARKLGLDYQQVEVDFDAPRVADFEHFVALMKPRHDEKVWVHCAANYRVSTFVAAYLEQHEGWSHARAERLRKRMWEPNDLWEKFAAQISAGS